MAHDPYHDRPEWSYSQLKLILDHGIDYAVLSKQKKLPQPASKAIDIGTIIHQKVLGGSDTYVVSPFDSFRTNAAKAWKIEQFELGNIIITEEEQILVDTVVENIKAHPYSSKYIFAKGAKYEQEMFAKTVNGIALRGKADVVIKSENLIITDLKTTAQFDKFVKEVHRKHYDLQSANYSFIGSAAFKVEPSLVQYKFCVAETVVPYRVQFFNATSDFIDAGSDKFTRCINEVVKFGDREPTVLLTEEPDLGDWSL